VFEEVSTATEGGATIRDVSYDTVDGRSVSAFLVTPPGDGPFPAVVFLHWLASNEPNGDRTEFLDEAITLAGQGVVSLLPQQVFPWKQPPAGAAEDRQAIIDQVVDVRIGLDALLALPDVDPERVAVVGHDFGGMYATLVAGLDARVDALVAAAGVPHFADWYLRYWRPVPASGEAAYRATMLEVDPVTFLPAFDGPVLLQFSKTDQYVDRAAIDAWTAASPPATTSVKTYAWNHSLHTESAQADRDAFLVSALGLEP
jgi:dienelactone hydrolase